MPNRWSTNRELRLLLWVGVGAVVVIVFVLILTPSISSRQLPARSTYIPTPLVETNDSYKRCQDEVSQTLNTCLNSIKTCEDYYEDGLGNCYFSSGQLMSCQEAKETWGDCFNDASFDRGECQDGEIIGRANCERVFDPEETPFI